MFKFFVMWSVWLLDFSHSFERDMERYYMWIGIVRLAVGVQRIKCARKNRVFTKKEYLIHG